MTRQLEFPTRNPNAGQPIDPRMIRPLFGREDLFWFHCDARDEARRTGGRVVAYEDLPRGWAVVP